MARLVLTEILSLGMSLEHNATWWQVATDEDFTDILVDVPMEEDMLYHFRTPIRNHDGTIRVSPDRLYARCKIWIEDEYMPWYYLPYCDPDYLLSLDHDGRQDLLSQIEVTNIY